MDNETFIKTFSDDLLYVEESYRLHLRQFPQISVLTWQSLCRVYLLIAISCVDFFIEHVLTMAKVKPTRNYKKDIEKIILSALKRNHVPNELDIPEKIEKYITLRELRHHLVHRALKKPMPKVQEKLKQIDLSFDLDKFTEKEFETIKKIISDTINLIGMSMILIDNPEIKIKN